MTHVFVYLVIASAVHGGSSWNVTPMPDMDVCEQLRESITRPRGFNFPRASLVRCIITWRDPPGMMDNVLLFLFKWGALAAGLAFFVWGIGYKLEFWGSHNPDEVFSSAFDTILPNLAVLSGVLILFGVFLRVRNR